MTAKHTRRLMGPNALRRLRLAMSVGDGERPLTQRAVARAIGVGLARYSNLENGHEPPTPREARELAKLFHVAQHALGVAPKKSARVAIHDQEATV